MIIRDYLYSDHCLAGFSDIVINLAIKDHQVVLPGLQQVLMNYLKSDFPNLICLSEDLLINIGWNPDVKATMFWKMEDTLHMCLRNPTIYDLAVENAM